MESYINLEKLSKGFVNPFLLASIIVIVLNIMVFFFFHPQVSRKIYFRSMFYMWLVTVSLVYLHHRALDSEYQLELENNMNINLINKTAGNDEEILPEIPKEKKNIITEDELI